MRIRLFVRQGIALILVGGLAAGGRAAAAPLRQGSSPTPAAVEAVVIVERAPVFSLPDRNSEPVTYLFEREVVPVLGRTDTWMFLLVQVDQRQGWILRVQVDLAGDLAQLSAVGTPTAATRTFTPFPTLTPSPAAPGGDSGGAPPTRTPLPTSTPGGTPTPALATGTPAPDATLTVLPGQPPPIEITLPEGWEQVHLIVPFRTFDDVVHDVPLTIYFGTLPGGANGFIYLYWGIPNTVDFVTGEYNLWADGVQILRGSLVGETCNLGVYEQQMFDIGALQGVGATYQASECEEEADTSGWFATLRVYDGTFAFYTAVEPWDALLDSRAVLQQILDTVRFVPPEAQ